ncbi:efflux RND transporter permease subunit [Methylotenera sp.]|uniref:efflux RND transporter permease subunit n=1 Tax=Methylotenera sp. TaxID=2051956 RepID=UPI002487A6DF|nr:efflux RND transporter permease subunit [Methylotenera sp.]MDI1297892.1 efflux RND transporter permease subunit [Methylotenera sp.]
MNISSWSIKNPVPALILFILLTLAGSMSFSAMKIQNFPDLDLPTVNVNASLPGASPAQLENQVARKLENSIAKLQGLRHIHTTIQDGNVSITAEFRLEKPVQEAVDDTRSAISEVRADLPTDLREPIVSKLNVAGSPILAFTLHSKRMDAEALSWFVDDALTKQLLGVKGVGGVARVGGVNRQIWVELDAEKLQSLNATAADISRQLSLIQLEVAGGVTKLSGSEQPIRTLANVKSADELANLEIALSDGRKVRLNQVANVIDTIAEPKSAAFLDGTSVIGFEVSRSKGASELEVGAGVYKVLDAIKLAHPDIEVTEAFNFVKPVQEEFDASMAMLYEGALLAVLVVWLFLRDFRATFVSAVALPLSIIPTFIGMNYLGFSINIVTLLALSLVVGVLVDDAIVEVENIVRHSRMGKSPFEAALEATEEIGLAVVATTFTLIAVFLPTAFMDGIPGKFFKQFGWTAAIAIFASLLVARLLTPMMAAYIMRPSQHETSEDGVVMRFYMRLARWCVGHRLLTSLAAIAFFIGSIWLIQFLPKGFVPADDNSQTQVRIELAPGATLAQTIAISEQARLILKDIKHVNSIYTTVGGGAAGSDPFAGGGSTEARKSTLTIQLDPRGSRPKKQVIETEMREKLQALPGVRLGVGLEGSGEKYIVALTSEDSSALASAASAVEKDLRTIKGLGNIASSAALVRPEVIVKPDFAAAADLGVTSNAIGETLRIATVGDYEQLLPKLNLDQRQVAIVVKINNAARQDLSTLGKLAVPSTHGGSVPLEQVANLEMSSGPAVISRYDRARNVQFNIELSGLPIGDAVTAVKNLPSIQHLPAGVMQAELGDAEMMGELFSSFGIAMLTGVICIYFVLVLLFKDFLQPITILVALPLSLGGAFLGLLVAGKALSMPSMIGLVMLMGIATKNSILLVEYAIVARRDHHMSRLEAILDACHKRARPIIMTTIAMTAGMLPVAMSLGAGDGSFRSPMAVSVIGGLLTSTLLSLLVIPVAFTLIDDVQQFFAKLIPRAKHGEIKLLQDKM